MNFGEIIKDTKHLIKLISKSGANISSKRVKEKAEGWISSYLNYLFIIFDNQIKKRNALLYLEKSYLNKRLNRKKWLKTLRDILKGLKKKQIRGVKKKAGKHLGNYIFSGSLLGEIKTKDKKISILGSETNFNWQVGCWNACGILMRIILERALDRKDKKVKQRRGLERKINYCLSNNIFGKTLSGALKKLQHSTKITGDIVAHDSNILLSEDDIELSIVPLNMIVKDVFKL